MSRIILKNGTVYTPHGVIHKGWLLIEKGSIVALDSGEHPACEIIIDARGMALLPGFIDLHVHGAVGYTTMQATRESLHAMAQFFARYGVTGFLASTVTASSAVLGKAIEAIAACKGPVINGSKILGAHLEGPYVNSQAKGAHNELHIRRANPSEYMPWLETGAVHQITIAPEYPENMLLIRECVARDIIASLGHSIADYACIGAAVQAGAQQSTHTFNGMAGIHHRQPGTAGAVLTHDALMCELIADLVHVHPAILKLAIRAKGIDKSLLVTDAESGTGMPHGTYAIDGVQRTVNESGVYLPDGTLAGSVLTMNKALYNSMQAAGLSLEAAWPMTSRNPARQLGLGHRKGELKVGYDADVVLLDTNDYSVAMTLCEGKIIYNACL